jgi:hypothetical protein
MQDQLAGAMKMALGAGLGSDLSTIPPDGRRAAGGVLKAMLLARESGCDCEPCKLLRPEIEKVMNVALHGLTEALTEPTEPVAPPATTPPMQEAGIAPGPDTSA